MKRVPLYWVGVAMLFALTALAQSTRSTVYNETNIRWSEFRAQSLDDGGVSVMGYCEAFGLDGGDRQVVETRYYPLTGATRTSALNFGNGPVERACRLELRVGDGGTP